VEITHLQNLTKHTRDRPKPDITGTAGSQWITAIQTNTRSTQLLNSRWQHNTTYARRRVMQTQA
jgi:hypothetical protein